MPRGNIYIAVTTAAGRDGANLRLQLAIANAPNMDDCGVTDGVHIIRSPEDPRRVFERLSRGVDEEDTLIIAPLAGSWLCQNARSPDECGKLDLPSAQREREVEQSS